MMAIQSLPPSTVMSGGRGRLSTRHMWLSHSTNVRSNPCFWMNLSGRGGVYLGERGEKNGGSGITMCV